MSRIYCPQCQSGVRAKAAYCESCGLKIPTALKFEPSRATEERGPTWAAMLVVMLLLVAVAIGFSGVIFKPSKPVASPLTAQDAKAQREAEAEQWLADKRQKDSDDENRKELARGILIVQKLHQIAKVPDSVKILSAKVSGNGGGVCVEYTANNSFNAALRGFAIIDPYDQIYFDNFDLKLFEKKYADYCAYTVKDITYEVNYYYPLIP